MYAGIAASFSCRTFSYLWARIRKFHAIGVRNRMCDPLLNTRKEEAILTATIITVSGFVTRLLINSIFCKNPIQHKRFPVGKILTAPWFGGDEFVVARRVAPKDDP